MEEREQIGWLLAAIFILAIGTAGLVAASYIKSGYMSDVVETQGMGHKVLKAMVKGSIYENGELMSVFGACLDSYDIPIEDSVAVLTSYYPDGSIWLVNQSMMNISPGYFVWQGYMGVIGGTYLTELTCTALNQTAKAFGEWQNPAWVNSIAAVLNLTNYSYMLITDIDGKIIGINATVEEVQAAVEALNQSMASINQTIINGFNATWQNLSFIQQNMTNNFNYTNQLILETQIIANGSVDRNNSLLAELLYMIMNYTTPPSSNLSWTEEYDEEPTYMKYWNIRVYVRNSLGLDVYSPEVSCTIVTNMHGLQYMEPGGNHFKSRLLITGVGSLNWTTNCYR